MQATLEVFKSHVLSICGVTRPKFQLGGGGPCLEDKEVVVLKQKEVELEEIDNKFAE